MMRNRWIAAAALAMALLWLLLAPRTVSSAAAGPDPGLPGNVLIADAGNNRVIEVTPEKRIVWEFPQPGDLAPGQSFVDPDDAFYTPGGRTIITNEEDNHTIAVIDYATRKIVWESGPPGRPGTGPGCPHPPDTT